MKFKVGDKVKWRDGKHHSNDKRIDIITKVFTDIMGDTRYETKEINNPKGQTPKIGRAYESYLILA